MISIKQLLDDARRGERTLEREAAVRLLSSSIRLAAAGGLSLRPRMLLLDQSGELMLDGVEGAAGPEERPGYVAPEVIAGLAPPDDPQALVYAAGAFGYELFTLKRSPDRLVPACAELPAEIAAILRKAMSPRHQRFRRLADLETELDAERSAGSGRSGAVPPGVPRTVAPSLADGDPTLEAQLEAAEMRAAELAKTLAVRESAAAERFSQLQRTIATLEDRVQLLTWIASRAAKAPRREPLIERPAVSRRHRQLLARVFAAVILAAAIAASVLAIRADGSFRESNAADVRPDRAPADAPMAPAGPPAPVPAEGPASSGEAKGAPPEPDRTGGAQAIPTLQLSGQPAQRPRGAAPATRR